MKRVKKELKEVRILIVKHIAYKSGYLISGIEHWHFIVVVYTQYPCLSSPVGCYHCLSNCELSDMTGGHIVAFLSPDCSNTHSAMYGCVVAWVVIRLYCGDDNKPL